MILSVTDHSFDLQVELTEAGVVHYAVYDALVQVAAVDSAAGVMHSNLDPSAAQVVELQPQDFIGGLAGSGVIEVPRAYERVVTSITPPCSGSVCDYSAYGLAADTAFRCLRPTPAQVHELIRVCGNAPGHTLAWKLLAILGMPVPSIRDQLVRGYSLKVSYSLMCVLMYMQSLHGRSRQHTTSATIPNSTKFSYPC